MKMETDSLVEEVYSMIMDVLNKDQLDLLTVKIMLTKAEDENLIKKTNNDKDLDGVNIVKQNVYGIPLDACYQSMMSIIESSLNLIEKSE